MEPVDLSALILAGSRADIRDRVAEEEGVSHKALIVLEGQTLLARVIAALRGAGIRRILVVANDPHVQAEALALEAEVMKAASGPSASVEAGFLYLGAPMLVTTADHALLESAWVLDFIQNTPIESDVSLLLANRVVVECVAPQSRRTWLSFADGQWTGCNLFLLSRTSAGAAIDLWRRVEADRKRPWRMAATLGVGTLLRYALGRLTIEAAITQLGARVGIKASMVRANDGRAAIDVDKPSDLADVRVLLKR